MMWSVVVLADTVSDNNMIPEKAVVEEVDAFQEVVQPEGATILDSGTYGSWLQWSIDSDGLLTITGTGGYGSEIDSLPPWYFSSSRKYITSAKVNVTKIWSTYGMFRGCYNLKTVDLSGLDTSEVVNMAYMFTGCESLETIDLSGFDTSKVKYMSGMFSSCGFKQLPDMSSFDTSNVTDMSQMFAWCPELQTVDLSNFNTSKVTDISFMFRGCTNLKQVNLSKFDTTNVTNMSGLFAECTSLETADLSNFNTSKVTDMSEMFCMCEKLKSVDVSSFDTSKVTNMYAMFSNCLVLEVLDLSHFDTSAVTNMEYMFNWCKSLKELDISGFVRNQDCNVSYILNKNDNLEVAFIPKDFAGAAKFYLPDFPMSYEGTSVVIFGKEEKFVPLPVGTILKAEQLMEIEGKIPATSSFLITSSDVKNPAVAFCGVSDVNSPEVVIPNAVCYKGVVYRVTSISVTDFVSAKDNAKYKVTGNMIGQFTVEYIAPQSKKAKVTVASDTLYKGIRFTVTSVGPKAFKNNKKVKEIKVSDTIVTIGNDAFYGCKKLKKVTLGTGVIKIGKNAFCNCKKLTRITLKGSKLTSVGKKALKGVHKKCEIKVSKKKFKKYKKLFKKKGQAKTVKVVKK